MALMLLVSSSAVRPAGLSAEAVPEAETPPRRVETERGDPNPGKIAMYVPGPENEPEMA